MGAFARLTNIDPHAKPEGPDTDMLARFYHSQYMLPELPGSTAVGVSMSLMILRPL